MVYILYRGFACAAVMRDDLDDPILVMRLFAVFKRQVLLFGFCFIHIVHDFYQTPALVVGKQQLVPVRFAERLNHHGFVEQIVDIIRTMRHIFAIFALRERDEHTGR